MSDEVKIKVRPAIELDRNFILSTWLKGNYFGCQYFRNIPQRIYYKEYAEIILNALASPGIEINVACDELEPDWIVGFSVVKGPSLYWIYVKADYRGSGIGRLLLEGKDIQEVKSMTRIGRVISEQKNLTFNPF